MEHRFEVPAGPGDIVLEMGVRDGKLVAIYDPDKLDLAANVLISAALGVWDSNNILVRVWRAGFRDGQDAAELNRKMTSVSGMWQAGYNTGFKAGELSVGKRKPWWRRGW